MAEKSLTEELIGFTNKDQLVWHKSTKRSFKAVSGIFNLFIGYREHDYLLFVWDNLGRVISYSVGEKGEFYLYSAAVDQCGRLEEGGVRESCGDSLNFNESAIKIGQEDLIRQLRNR